jgi:transcriptional regulator with XRE-family HTH domain
MATSQDGVAGHFGKNLLALRKRAKMSQEALGKRSSLHRTEIGLLERGSRVPRIDTLVKLASALSVKPEALLHGINWTPESVRQGEFELGGPEKRSRRRMSSARSARG